MTRPLTVPFDETLDVQIAAARARNVIPPEQFYGRLPAEKRAQAFTVSGLARLDQIQAVADAMAQAQARGDTFADFQQWAEQQSWVLPRHRLEVIYRNAVQTSYMAGHWRHFEEYAKLRPYLMYDAINDSRTRPHHLALDGVIKPVGDAFWKTHSPPCGHNCRCSIRAIDRQEAMERGGTTQNLPAEGGPDEGWGYKPTGWSAILQRLKKEKLAAAHPVLAEVASRVLSGMDGVAQSSAMRLPESEKQEFAEWVANVLADGYLARHEFRKIGYLPQRVLQDADVAKIGLMRQDIETSDYLLRHGYRQSKGERGASLSASDLATLPLKLESSTWMFDPKHKNVVAFFEIDDQNMVGKAVVHFNYARKGNTHNAVITTGIVKRSNIQDGEKREI